MTTTRVTHASPAGLYAHVAERGWEDDVSVWRDGKNSSYCPDIAQQLIYDEPGKDFNVNIYPTFTIKLFFFFFLFCFLPMNESR